MTTETETARGRRLNDILCPFCHEHRAQPIRPIIHPGNARWWTIYCHACKASGPWQSSPQSARLAWEAVNPQGPALPPDSKGWPSCIRSTPLGPAWVVGPLGLMAAAFLLGPSYDSASPRAFLATALGFIAAVVGGWAMGAWFGRLGVLEDVVRAATRARDRGEPS